MNIAASKPSQPAEKIFSKMNQIFLDSFMNEIIGVLQVVSNLESQLNFYTEVLGFKEIGRYSLQGYEFDKLFKNQGAKGELVKLQLGPSLLYLLSFHPKKDPFPSNTHSHDHWFQHIAIVVSDMDRAYARLLEYKQHEIIFTSPQPQQIPEWNEAAAGIRAFYFRSPDGHPLELIYYPRGKGRSEWQKKHPSDLFLGIDHTAITVTDTASSLSFYQQFGMHEAGSSLNYGKEQELLSGEKGAKVKITSLQLPDTSKLDLEFLQYLSPENGKKRTDKLNNNGEVYTLFKIDHLSNLIERLDDKNLLSKVLEFDKSWEFNQAIVLEDPDQHKIMLINKW